MTTHGRRLLPHESMWIARWLDESKDHGWLQHYEEAAHKAWVQGAISEVRVGRRVAFGLFLKIENITTHGDDRDFIGSVILKQGRYTDEIELKNLIVSRRRSTELCAEHGMAPSTYKKPSAICSKASSSSATIEAFDASTSKYRQHRRTR